MIDAKAFDLMADYENIVNPDFRNGKEMIFSIQLTNAEATNEAGGPTQEAYDSR